MISIEELYSIYIRCQKVFIDSRLSLHGGLFFALNGEHFDGNDYALTALDRGADYAVVDRKSLGQHDRCIVVDNVLLTLQKLANYHRRQLTIPVLGITGTNGKTTTKELIASVLTTKYKVLATKGNLNNHIGVPLTLLSIKDDHDMAVVEMGANHMGEIEFLCSIAEPDYGLITNVGTAHLEGFGSFDGVKKTKGELYRFIAQHGKGIFINNDNVDLMEMSAENIIKYSYAVDDESAQLKGDVARSDLYLVAKVLFRKGWLYIKSKLTGRYNLENILAAVRIGLFFEVDPLCIQKGIEDYVPANNRSQVMKKGNVTLFLDCYNANPSSMQASLLNFSQIGPQKKIVVLGDMLELGDSSILEHQKVVDQLMQSGLDQVFLVGDQFRLVHVSDSFRCYRTVVDLIADISFSKWEGAYVLIKGSRGIQLEKIIDVI